MFVSEATQVSLCSSSGRWVPTYQPFPVRVHLICRLTHILQRVVDVASADKLACYIEIEPSFELNFLNT